MQTQDHSIGQSWIVFKDNKFVGYVISPSEIDALRKASEKFGSNTRIERSLLVGHT